MARQPMRKVARKRGLGVHVRMRGETFTRKLLSISINKQDGGVIITPILDEWGESFGSHMEVADDGGLIPQEESFVRGEGKNRLKFHYHRSGMASVQPQNSSGGENRRTAHLPALDQLDGTQIFSVAARLPGKLSWEREARNGDIVNIMDRYGVRSLLLGGVIYDRKLVPDESIGGVEPENPVTFSSGSRTSVLIDLSAHGLEAVLGLHFNPMPDKLPEFSADFSLVCFNIEQVTTEGAIAIHAGSGIPLAAWMDSIPPISDIHRVVDLKPIAISYPNKLPPK